MRDPDDWIAEERVFKNYLDTLADDPTEDDDGDWADVEYMTREEMDLP